ncbi:hypothetical protein FI667_g9592, partial [Globisporangium splendens]
MGDNQQLPASNLTQLEEEELDQLYDELQHSDTAESAIENNSNACESAASANDSVESAAPRFGLAQRKRTYERRKDESESLAKEIKALEAKLDYLRHQAGIPDQQVIAQQRMNNTLLREILRNQQYSAASFRSAVSADTSELTLRPVFARLHLGADLSQRREQLRELRPHQLANAKRFIEARTQFTDPTLPLSESSRFQNADGDTFAVKFDVIPLPRAKSVQQVYEAILFYLLNSEVCMAEMFGDYVLRDIDDQTGDARFSQHRLVGSSQDGVHFETNSIVYSNFEVEGQLPEQKKLIGEGLITTDFVDQDDLYPYCPDERLRKDVTSVWMVKGFVPQCIDNASTSQQQLLQKVHSPRYGEMEVVVLTRWVQSKLHGSTLGIPDETLIQLTETTNRANDEVVKAVCALPQLL